MTFYMPPWAWKRAVDQYGEQFLRDRGWEPAVSIPEVEVADDLAERCHAAYRASTRPTYVITGG